MRARLSRILGNVGLQVVSLFLAIIVWLHAVGEQSVEVSVQVPLRVDPPTASMRVLNSSLQNLSVTLSVPRNLLSMVTTRDITAYYQIRGVEKAGAYSFHIEAKNISLPPGNIRVVKISPEIVTVTLDEVIIQKLSVRVNFNPSIFKPQVLCIWDSSN